MASNPSTVKLTGPGPRLTRFDFHAIELEMRAELPEDYKQFLLKTNGGTPEPRLGFEWICGTEEVAAFTKLLPTPEHGLRLALRNVLESNIIGYLPIAGTLGDDVCIAYRDSNVMTFAEYIYTNDFVVGATMHKIAESFTDFVNSLVEIEDPYCRIEELGKSGKQADLAKYLAEGNSINAISKNGRSILCEAILYDNRPIIEACLAQRADLTKTIRVAANNYRFELIPRLVELGADINEQDEHGQAPLFYVGGELVPGKFGVLNRKLRTLLISLGGHE